MNGDCAKHTAMKAYLLEAGVLQGLGQPVWIQEAFGRVGQIGISGSLSSEQPAQCGNHNMQVQPDKRRQRRSGWRRCVQGDQPPAWLEDPALLTQAGGYITDIAQQKTGYYGVEAAVWKRQLVGVSG